MVETGNKKSKEPAYRLAKGVTCHQQKKAFQLVLSYPLKAIRLHPSWGAVFKALAGREFVPLDTIASLLQGPEPLQVELFLNDLVSKGFLETENTPALSDYPFVSIIIPVRNRPREIEDCLRSLEELYYPSSSLEILVVDDASTDDTPQRVSRFPVELIRLQENRQAPHCRNLAAKKAKGDILAFIDSDCRADPQWLRDLVPVFRDTRIAAVGGRVEGYFKDSGLDRYEAVKSSLIIGRRIRRSADKDMAFYVPSCNLLARKDVFLSLGGFKESLIVGEDVDFCWRLQDAGHHVEFRPTGRIHHKHRNRLIPFCKRRYDYGTSEPMLQHLHPNRGKEMVFPLGASLFWSMGMIAGLFQTFLPLVLWVGIVFVDSLGKRKRVRQSEVPIPFPALFLSVVRSYGVFFYNGCAFMSRYYLIWSIPVLLFWPLVFLVLWAMHVFTGLLEYVMRKPRLNLVGFLFYFSLDQLSYQSGVWWGCLRHLSFRAVNPRLVREAGTLVRP
ncbi:MAG: mycofactocin biosynthesis glycosyltransferase MftF [Deltaproteobacteria bacterium]|nr:mycofactocin biosynthesis glycosyltransferase MftF [Deltaproteobacteria bacterium]